MANIVKRIKKLSLTVLGCEAEPWDNIWERIRDLADAFGDHSVETVFEEWAATRQGEMIRKPVEEFLKVAPGLLQGITSLKPNQEIIDLVNELVYYTQGAVVFDKEQQIALGRLLTKYSSQEVQKAFHEFYSFASEDAFQTKHAARKFIETAEQLIYFKRKITSEMQEVAQILTDRAEQGRRDVARNLPPEEEEIIDLP
jgi:hypothetical protein